VCTVYVTQRCCRPCTELTSTPDCCTLPAPGGGFTTAADRQRIEGLLRRAVRAGYRRANDPTAAQLVEDSDDQLFHRVQYGGGHVLQPLLPDRRTNSSPLGATGNITCSNRAQQLITILLRDSCSKMHADFTDLSFTTFSHTVL